MRLITTNASDSATLTATGFVGSLPVTNLQLEGRSLVARTNNAAGPVVILGDWTGGQSVAAACLYRHNLTGGATWRVELFSGAAQSGTRVYDSGAVLALAALGWGEFAWGAVPWGQFAMLGWDSPYSVMWFTGVTAMSFRITLTDVGNTAGYIQAKRLILGAYVEPQFNAAYKMALTWQDSSRQFRTGAGSLRTENESTWRRLEARIDALSDAERATLFEVSRAVGLRREVFVSVYPTATDANSRDFSMLCKYIQVPTQTAESHGRFAQSFVFEEV